MSVLRIGLLFFTLSVILMLPSSGSGNLQIQSQKLPIGIFRMFGPSDHFVQAGPPVETTRTFGAFVTNIPFTLRIFNGGSDNQFGRISSASVLLNGVQVAGPSDFNQNIYIVERTVALRADNSLTVRLQGAPGTGISIEIIGVDNDAPTIAPIVSPHPNSAGWNNTNVVLSFNCADALSGIANCSPPAYLTSEGANQSYSGVANDRANNSSSTSVTLNIDKTPPLLSVTSPPGDSNVDAATVTISGLVSDALSGVASVTCGGSTGIVSGQTFSCPITLSQGRNVIDVRARDVAGNESTSLLTVTRVTSSSSVGPAGGTVFGANGQIKIVVPPGALESDIDISVTRASDLPNALPGTVFELGPDGTRFLKPVLVTIFYDSNALDPSANPADLRVLSFHNADPAFQLPNTMVDQVVRSVTAQLVHFSVVMIGLPPTPRFEVALRGPTEVEVSWGPQLAVPLARAYVGHCPPNQSCPGASTHFGCRAADFDPVLHPPETRLSCLGGGNPLACGLIAPSPLIDNATQAGFYCYALLTGNSVSPIGEVYSFGRGTTAPAPMAFSASASLDGSVLLNWFPVQARPDEYDLVGYYIIRTGGGPTKTFNVGFTSTSLIDSDVASQTSYFYQIWTVTAAGYSVLPSSSSVTTLVPVGGPTASFTWTVTCCPIVLTLDASASTGTGLLYTWDLSWTTANPDRLTEVPLTTVNFRETDRGIITLTVTDNSGRSATVTRSFP